MPAHQILYSDATQQYDGDQAFKLSKRILGWTGNGFVVVTCPDGAPPPVVPDAPQQTSVHTAKPRQSIHRGRFDI